MQKGEIATGTQLIDIVLTDTLPRLALINGSMCRVWYHGQPVICNICGTHGHKSAVCPNQNKCPLCNQEGHIARNCPNPWGTETVAAPASGSVLPQASASVINVVPASGTPVVAPVNSDSSPQAQGSSDPELSSSAAPAPVGCVVSPQAQVPGSSNPPLSSLGAPSVVVSVPVGAEVAAVPQPSEQLDEVFVDASDGSDIDEFPDTSSESAGPSSQCISDFSQRSDSVQIVKVVSATDSGSPSQSILLAIHSCVRVSSKILIKIVIEHRNPILFPEKVVLQMLVLRLLRLILAPPQTWIPWIPPWFPLNGKLGLGQASLERNREVVFWSPLQRGAMLVCLLCHRIDLLGFDALFVLLLPNFVF